MLQGSLWPRATTTRCRRLALFDGELCGYKNSALKLRYKTCLRSISKTVIMNRSWIACDLLV